MTKHSYLSPALLVILAVAADPARADCTADQGSPEQITADGVTVSCDSTPPNPFTSGIGSLGTNTNLTVEIEAEASLDVTGDGVSLANGGNLTNEGAITASDTAVIGVDQSGSAPVTIDNQGSLSAGSGAGIDLATSLESATVTNAGSIAAATRGIRLSGGQIDNSGTISVSDASGVGIDAGSGSATSNSGTITSAGTGLVDNSGSITNSGRIEAAALGLDLTASELDNSGEIESTDSALLVQGGSITNSGSITSTAGVGIDAGGGVTLNNTGTVSGVGDAIRLSGGGNTLTLGTGSTFNGSVQGSGDVAGGDSLVLEGQGSEDSDIGGFASLTMQGADWSLAGDVEVRSATIGSGRLEINGLLDTSLGSGLVTLSGGELGGTGRIIGDVLNSAGALAAGATTGTLTIDGNYTQQAGANLRVSSDSSGGVGLLRITGTANLAGTVTVSAGSDGIYDFLVADGGIQGEFDELAVDGRALIALLSTENTISFVRASTTVEDNMVHAALDSSVLSLDALSPSGRLYGGGGVWFKALGHYGERDEVDGIAGGDFDIVGGMAGLDWRPGDGKFAIGAGIGASHSDVDVDDGSDGEIDSVLFGAYLEYAPDAFHARLTLAGASNEFEHSRRISVNNERTLANADYDGDSLAARFSVGTTMPMGGQWASDWRFEPELWADYLLLDLDPYIEEGGTGLEISAQDDIEAAEFAAVFQVRRLTPDSYGLAPRAHIGVTHRIAIDDREWIAEADTRLLLPGNDGDITAFRFGVGADMALGRHWRATFDYLGELGDDADAHSLVASIKRLL